MAMKRRVFISGAGAAVVAHALDPRMVAAEAPAGSRLRTCLDADWLFWKGDLTGAEAPGFDASTWRSVSLPHDWSIEGPFTQDAPARGASGWTPGGVGWYRKNLELPARERGRTAWIEFDGIYHRSEVWINGRPLGRHDYGYASFYYDLTPHLRFGERNVLAVRVDNSDQPNCRYYSGSGIYRHVWLTQTGDVHVAHWGTSLTTPVVAADAAQVALRTRVQSRKPGVAFALETTILDSDGHSVASRHVAGRTDAAGSAELAQTFDVLGPRLWSIEDPALYAARSAVLVGGRCVDDYLTPFGIREARFDKDRGFLLNGRGVKMKGVCLHHDGGCVGAAVPEAVLRRRLAILKDLGCNAIRCSHNPPAPELLDLCDRMGFLVIDEAFDKWEGNGDRDASQWYMRQRGFGEWWPQELQSMLERDRNHPSVVLWSVGNEVGEPGTDEVNPLLAKLVDYVHRAEPTRPVTSALILPHGRTLPERVAQVVSSAKLMDVLGANYQEPLYPHIRAAAPATIICGTESWRYWRNSEQLRHAYDPTNPWYDVMHHDYVVGQFIWSGIDYLGESDSWPSRGWSSGLVDSCGFPKPDSSFQRSVWRSEPLVHIAVFESASGSGERAWSWGAPRLASHWNFPQLEGQLARLQVQTNCETVELLLNGSCYGQHRAADYPNCAPVWYVPYAPGRIEAVGRNGGEIVARHELRTAGPCAQIVLQADRTSLAADGRDVAHVEVQLRDAEGVLVPNGDRTLRIQASGTGAVLGHDNGDLSCQEPYRGETRTTRGGRCLIIVQAARRSGALRLEVSEPSLPPAVLVLETRAHSSRISGAGRDNKG
jgi:beta-galactosidase